MECDTVILTKQFQIPCLHRIHLGKAKSVHKINFSIGMSIELNDLIMRLESLNREAVTKGVADRSILITFDDAWSDVMQLIPTFKQLTKLQPVVFITHQQLIGNNSHLPLARLYEWCAENGHKHSDLIKLGVDKTELKSKFEQEQNNILDKLGIPRKPNSDLLCWNKLQQMTNEGWLFGSHSHDHHDLRFDEEESLLSGLTKARITIEEKGGLPWLAWPEGRCTMRTCEIAKSAGFTKQFSLDIEAGDVDHPDLIQRTIWS